MNAPIVIKLGGGVLDIDLTGFWSAVREIHTRKPVVIVHGGGKQSTALSGRLGHTPTMVEGRRITTDTDLDVLRWVIRGQLNTDLTASALAAGIRAAGVSGVDGSTVLVTRRPPWNVQGREVEFGHVGDVVAVDATLLSALMDGGYIPILATMGVDREGAVYNVNGDTVALEVAAALHANELILATESSGVLDAEGALMARLDLETADHGIRDGWIEGGMKVKSEVGFKALERGIASVWITGVKAMDPDSGTRLVLEKDADFAAHRPAFSKEVIPAHADRSIDRPQGSTAQADDESVVSLHAMLVSIPSLSRQERLAADALERYFRDRDLAVQRMGDNVIASLGDGPDTLLLNSHLDVVPPSKDHPFAPFEPTVREGNVYGRGTVDAKASVAAMSRALCNLARAGWQPPAGSRVMGAFTVCEELGGEYNGLEEVLPELQGISAALVGEPTMMQPCVAQKGLLILKMVASGRTSHAARPGEGDNAISRAARDIARIESFVFNKVHPYLGETTANITMIEGGSARNVIPDECTVWIDIRTTPSYTHPEITTMLQEVLESTLHVHSERFVPVDTDPGSRIVRACVRAHAGSEPFGSPTMSDWTYLRGTSTVKIGPGDSRLSHTADEHVALTELERGCTLYEHIIRTYFEDDHGE